MKYKSINFVEFESDLTKAQARECIQFAQSCNNEDGNFFDPDAMDMSDLDPSYVPSYNDAIHDAFWDQYDWFKCVQEIEKVDSSGHITNEKEVEQFASKLLNFIYQYLGFNDTKEQIEAALGKKKKTKQRKKEVIEDIPWSNIIDSEAKVPMSRLLYDATNDQNFDVLFFWAQDCTGPKGMMSVTVKNSNGTVFSIRLEPPEALVKKASVMIPQFVSHKVELRDNEICFVKNE